MKIFDLKFASRLVLAVAVAVMVACSWLAPLDLAANQQVDAGLKRALISFATSRALNAVISVAQGTEVAIQPAGVGVNFAPGQLLEPINKLVEQFSDLMLAASVAFGVQKVLMTIGAHWLISLLLTLTAVIWSFCYLRQHMSLVWLSRILAVLLMIRFAMPVAIIGSDMLFQTFMAADYQSSQQVIDTASGKLEQLDPPLAITDENQSWLDKLKGWSQSTDVKARFENFKRSVEQTTEHIIKLMVIFLLQTLILPLLLLWILWGVARRTFQ